jgi:nucleoside-diphosphate-sugar epimerase
MTRFLAEELSTAHWFNISAAKKDLSYAPKTSFEEGFIRLQEWFHSESGLALLR